MKLIKDRKIFGWVMYDWANSSFATTVMAGFFPVFFKSYWSAGADVNQSTAMLGFANSIASAVVALLAPILGAISDQSSGKKKMLIFFAYMGALLTGCLFMVRFGQWMLAAAFYVIGTVGFSGANIFYDGLLPHVANERNIDYVSAKGYALGYLGGGLLFLFNVLWYLQPGLFGFPVEKEAKILAMITEKPAVIQIVDDADFSIPAEFEVGKAIISSEFIAPIQIVNIEETPSGRQVSLHVNLPTDFDFRRVDSTFSFGGLKKADLLRFDPESSEMLVTNLTRRLAASDSIHILRSENVTYRKFNNGQISEIEGLNQCYQNPVIRTDFLEPQIEFLAIRVSFVSVALWWALFTIPLILWVKEKKRFNQKVKTNYVIQGFRQLWTTFRKIRHLKVVFLFLVAYWLYIDGVDTIIRMAVDYGMSIGFPSSSLIIALLITQFVGFPCALIFGKLGERWDVKKSIFIAIIVYIGVTVWGVMMSKTMEFYLLAVVIGLVQGGIQALSRSYYSRIIPKDQSGEFYGFFNMLGKFAAIVGPALIGIIGLLVRRAGYSANTASRAGIGSVSILFILGGILLYFVDENRGRKEAEYLRLDHSDETADR
jgi:MFS-type transporter involved in bile tolerance (Atg22 family)